MKTFVFYKKNWNPALVERSKYYLLFVNHVLLNLPEHSSLLVVEKLMGCLDGFLGYDIMSADEQHCTSQW